MRRCGTGCSARKLHRVQRSFDTYRAIGHRFVTGFLQPEILSVLSVLDAAQRAKGISGAVAEIGVHHGKLFIGLRLLQRNGERSVAIDIFGEQELNIDGSGRGDQQKFLGNVNLWASEDSVVVHQGDSTLLDPEKLCELADSRIRLFSVDGGHTEQIVLSDMMLAERTLAEGGIVIADDVFNEHWPGVSVGTLRYLDRGASLAPFFIAFNKVFFTQPQFCDYYRTQVESAFDRRRRLGVHESVFAGYEVGLLFRHTPVDMLRRSETARSVYHRTYREMVRAMQFMSDKTSPARRRP
jgi:hypothetical protein